MEKKRYFFSGFKCRKEKEKCFYQATSETGRYNMAGQNCVNHRRTYAHEANQFHFTGKTFSAFIS